jgi:hypothetical protein
MARRISRRAFLVRAGSGAVALGFSSLRPAAAAGPGRSVSQSSKSAPAYRGANEKYEGWADLYEEFHAERGQRRDFEEDAMHVDATEKIFDDEEISRIFRGRATQPGAPRAAEICDVLLTQDTRRARRC